MQGDPKQLGNYGSCIHIFLLYIKCSACLTLAIRSLQLPKVVCQCKAYAISYFHVLLMFIQFSWFK